MSFNQAVLHIIAKQRLIQRSQLSATKYQPSGGRKRRAAPPLEGTRPQRAICAPQRNNAGDEAHQTGGATVNRGRRPALGHSPAVPNLKSLGRYAERQKGETKRGGDGNRADLRIRGQGRRRGTGAPCTCAGPLTAAFPSSQGAPSPPSQ